MKTIEEIKSTPKTVMKKPELSHLLKLRKVKNSSTLWR